MSVNPEAVCTVSIVPTSDWSDSSATDAENWAESATIEMPQTMQTATSSAGEPPNRMPTPAAQLPEIAIATMVSVVRPSRSARPAATQPDRPGADRGERGKLGGSGRDLGSERERKARVEEQPDPRPHRIQLPHVAEIAEVGEAQGDVAPGGKYRGRIGSRRRRAIWTEAGEIDQERGGERGDRCDLPAPPVDAAEGEVGGAMPNPAWAPTRIPTIRPMSPRAQVEASFMPTG